MMNGFPTRVLSGPFSKERMDRAGYVRRFRAPFRTHYQAVSSQTLGQRSLSSAAPAGISGSQSIGWIFGRGS